MWHNWYRHCISQCHHHSYAPHLQSLQTQTAACTFLLRRIERGSNSQQPCGCTNFPGWPTTNYHIYPFICQLAYRPIDMTPLTRRTISQTILLESKKVLWCARSKYYSKSRTSTCATRLPHASRVIMCTTCFRAIKCNKVFRKFVSACAAQFAHSWLLHCSSSRNSMRRIPCVLWPL